MQTLIPISKREYLRWTIDQELKKSAERDGFLLTDLDDPRQRPKPKLVAKVLQLSQERKDE
jgi:hypothetical protein